MKQSHKERWAHLGAEELSVGIKDFAGDAKEHARWAARAQETADSLRKELRRRKAIEKSPSAEPVRSEASEVPAVAGPES